MRHSTRLVAALVMTAKDLERAHQIVDRHVDLIERVARADEQAKAALRSLRRNMGQPATPCLLCEVVHTEEEARVCELARIEATLIVATDVISALSEELKAYGDFADVLDVT